MTRPEGFGSMTGNPEVNFWNQAISLIDHQPGIGCWLCPRRDWRRLRTKSGSGRRR